MSFNDDDPPDGEVGMDTSCSHCVGAAEVVHELKDGRATHCSICNCCSLANCTQDRKDFTTICLELECGLSTVTDVNKFVTKLGRFSWTCIECLEKVKDFIAGDTYKNKLDEKESQQETLLNKLSTESSEMSAKLDDVLDVVGKLSYGMMPASPIRKCARVSFDDGDDSPSMELFDAAGLKQPSPVTGDAHRNNAISYSDKVKLNIKKDESSTSSDFMKSLHDAKNIMPSFTGKKKANGSIDVLFKSFEDANKAKTYFR